jgi:hypothetical protein
MARRQYTKDSVCASVAKSLREFGYPDVTAEMIAGCLDAWLADPNGVMPHGIIGMFAKRQFDEVEEARPGALAAFARANDGGERS